MPTDSSRLVATSANLRGLLSLLDACREQWDAHRQIFGELDHAEPCCSPCAELDALTRGAGRG